MGGVDEGQLSQLRELDGRCILVEDHVTGEELRMRVKIEDPHYVGVMKGIDGIAQKRFNVTVRLSAEP